MRFYVRFPLPSIMILLSVSAFAPQELARLTIISRDVNKSVLVIGQI